MSLNTAHADNGVLVHQGEAIILFAKNVTLEFHGQESPEFKGSKNGRMYLTTHRLIYNSDSLSASMRSFSFPYVALHDITVEQPVFGANYIKGKVRAQPNGNWLGEAKFKLTFKAGGAIDFGQAMLKLAHMASRGFNDAPPPYVPPEGPWAAAPPPAYSAQPQGYYGWVPPTNVFPDRPSPNTVFMSSAPPPYPGVGSYAPQAGFQAGPAYPPAYGGNAYGGNAYGGDAYAGGYSAPPAYPGQTPTQNGGYPYGGYPPATSGMSSADAKAAEAAASAGGYTNDTMHKASAPPAYQEPPPTYQQSTHKKDN